MTSGYGRLIYVVGATACLLAAPAGATAAGSTLDRAVAAAPRADTTSSAFQTKAYAGPLAVVLCVLLLAVFFDPHRPFRVLHFDLAALTAFIIPHGLYRQGHPALIAPITFVLLAYLLARMLFIAFRPRLTTERLLPFVGTGFLAVALLLLVSLRIGLDVAASDVIDVGYASVVGADRVSKGQSLYEGDFPALVRPGYLSGHGDTYGPLTYYAYVPFEQIFPWSGRWDSLPAAHAAAIVFDVLTILGLIALGRTMRTQGRWQLGLALAFAWAAYPYSLLILLYNTNDALISLCLVWSLVLVRSPAGRGAWLAVGTGAKLVPGALVPLYATIDGWRRRDVLTFSVVFLALAALLFVPVLPDGGFRELYDRTIGFQVHRDSVFTIWSRFPALDAVRPLFQAGAVALAVVAAFVPRRRTPLQVAALGAAVLIALQLAHTYWFVLYIPWWTPLVLAAFFGRYRLGDEPTASAREA